MPQIKVVSWFFFVVLLVSCKSTPQKNHPYSNVITFPLEQKPKNIVLMIGDGMGLAQVSTMLYSNNNRMELEKFPVIGFHKSYSADNLITDSAAGATAFACGVKTYNGAIGLNADSIPVRSIFEEIEAKGMSTGLVVTTMLNHATPAAFYAHQKIRVLLDQIAADFLKTEIDFVVAGGKRYFDNRTIDNRDLIDELRAKGYVVADYMQGELSQIGFNPKNNFIYFTADKDPPAAGVGRTFLPYASEQALRFLEQHDDQGFFLMVEGSQIDWACHNQRGNWAEQELKDFDNTIKKVLEYAQKDGNTLVIVTGDHETGGLAINQGSKMNRLKTAFTTNAHTASMVPVFAYGPSAQLFAGIYENTDIYRKMRQALGLTDSTSALNE